MSSSDPYPVLKMLQSHLEGRLRLGQTRLWLADGAMEALREIVRMKPRPRSLVPEPSERPVAVMAAIAVAAPEARPAIAQVEAEHPRRLILPERIQGPPEPKHGDLSLTERETRLEQVRVMAQEGGAARALGTLRERLVFSAGTPMADIVLVGGAPGAEDEAAAEPFVGPAGQLLGRILKAMGLDRSQVYLTLLCKFRPQPGPGEDGERTLTAEEGAACLPWLKEEIAIIRPKVVVVLGDIPFAGLLGRFGGVMQGRGKFYTFDGIPVMATLDPSWLQQKETEGTDVANAEKRKLWEDMLMVMEKVGLPVSEKQRTFFLPR